MILTKNLLQEKNLEFTNSREDLITVWFSSKTKNFCLELNCKVIKATKNIKPIQEKLNFLISL